MITVLPTKEEDIQALIDDIRFFDQLEVVSMHPGKNIHDVIKNSIDESEYSQSVYGGEGDNKKLLCLYGLSEREAEDTPLGVPWMLGTNELFKRMYKVDILRRGKKIVQSMAVPYKIFGNVVHKSNYQSHKFLKFCGFHIDKTKDYIFNNEIFYAFYFEREA